MKTHELKMFTQVRIDKKPRPDVQLDDLATFMPFLVAPHRPRSATRDSQRIQRLTHFERRCTDSLCLRRGALTSRLAYCWHLEVRELWMGPRGEMSTPNTQVGPQNILARSRSMVVLYTQLQEDDSIQLDNLSHKWSKQT
jgi:hypothetical protein